MDVYFDRIKPLFDSSGMTVRELAKEIGIPEKQIYNWNTGHTTSYTDYLPKIARYFHVSADYLLGLADAKTGHFPPPEEQPAEIDELPAMDAEVVNLLRDIPVEFYPMTLDLVKSVLLSVIRGSQDVVERVSAARRS